MNHHGSTNNLNSLTHDPQTGFARGEEASFRRLRNRVNRLRKSCRPKYYESKVEYLRDCAPRRWSNDVKRLGGVQSATRTDPTSVLKRFESGPGSSLKALANTINNAFLAPMNSFSPLHPEASGDVQHTNPPTVTEFRVLKKLTRLNPAKASGPDGIPACLLKENADILPKWLVISLTVHTRRLDYPTPGRRPILPLFRSRPLRTT